MEEIILTKAGLEEKKEELAHLVNVVRAEIKDKIKEARSQGDLSENAEYDAAREEQGKTEARIKELEYIIKNAKVIEDKKRSSKVIVGSKVTFVEVKTKKEFTYSIVGSVEANPSNGKMSDVSPVGKALLGKKAKDIVAVETPAGVKKFEIIKVR